MSRFFFFADVQLEKWWDYRCQGADWSQSHGFWFEYMVWEERHQPLSLLNFMKTSRSAFHRPDTPSPLHSAGGPAHPPARHLWFLRAAHRLSHTAPPQPWGAEDGEWGDFFPTRAL